MRITVDGQRVENNIRKSILPNLWDQSKERAKGTSSAAVDLNRFIEDARIRIHQIVTELQQTGAEINPLIVQQRFYGVGQVRKQERTILQVIQEHNDEAKQLIGKDFVEITWRRYETMKRYLGELIKHKYGVDDLPLSDYNRKNEMSIFQKRNEQIFSFFASFFLLLFRPLKHQLKADFKPLKQA